MIRKPFAVYFNITIGVILIALAYYFLFLPHDLVIGGVTGLAIIFNEILNGEVVSSVFIYILYIVLLVVGFFIFGRGFLLKTLYGSLLLPTVILLLEISKINPYIIFEFENKYFEAMNPMSEMILSVLLGSLLTGVGLGLCFRNNATTGGMDIVQKAIVKFFHFPYSKTVYVTDGIVVLIALIVFGIEKTMYSLISIFLIGLFIDTICMGGTSRRTAFIISDKNEEIKKIIIEKLERGVTIVPSTGGYSDKSYDMLVCTLNKSESYILKDLILEVDAGAFMFFVSAKEVYGDGFE